MSQYKIDNTIVTLVYEDGSEHDVKVKDISDPFLKQEVVALVASTKLRIKRIRKLVKPKAE